MELRDRVQGGVTNLDAALAKLEEHGLVLPDDAARDRARGTLSAAFLELAENKDDPERSIRSAAELGRILLRFNRLMVRYDVAGAWLGSRCWCPLMDREFQAAYEADGRGSHPIMEGLLILPGWDDAKGTLSIKDLLLAFAERHGLPKVSVTGLTPAEILLFLRESSPAYKYEAHHESIMEDVVNLFLAPAAPQAHAAGTLQGRHVVDGKLRVVGTPTVKRALREFNHSLWRQARGLEGAFYNIRGLYSSDRALAHVARVRIGSGVRCAHCGVRGSGRRWWRRRGGSRPWERFCCCHRWRGEWHRAG